MARRYHKAPKKLKGVMLDELSALTGGAGIMHAGRCGPPSRRELRGGVKAEALAVGLGAVGSGCSSARELD